MKTHSRTCPRCNASKGKRLVRYSNSDWEIVECGDCGFYYVPAAPDYEELASNLAWEKTSKNREYERTKQAPRFRRFHKTIKSKFSGFRKDQTALLRTYIRPGPVLDLGCGGGCRVPQPFTPFGVEISEELSKKADAFMRRRGGYTVNAPALDGLRAFSDASFEGIIMRSFLEHEDRPRAVLELAHAKLRTGGVVFIRVPNFGSLNALLLGAKWCGIRLPDHLNYFTNKQLRAMSEEAQYHYDLLDRWKLPTDDNIKAILKKRGGRTAKAASIA